MLNPASLFVACLITLAANPSLVSAIPLPPAAPHRTAPAVLRHRSFRSTHRLPVLRIVEDDDRAEPASSWMQAFTDESILPESIFALEEDKLLTLELAAIHRSHDVKRNLISQLASGRPLAKKATKSSKRVKRSPSEPSIRKTKHEKRFSSRWLKGQEAAKSRAAEQTSTASAIVWTKVPTSTTAAVAESTSPASTTTTSTVASSTESAVSISGTHSGDGTWFAPGLGACGTVATDDSPIVAVSHLLYDSYPGATANPNLNPICGKQIRATYAGKTVDVTVQDRCTGCAMWDLDFSPTLFGELADLDVGRLKGVEWSFV